MAVKEHHKTQLLKIIHSYLPNCKVWLFGSRARNQERAGSDIDLALDNGEKIPWGTITKMLIDIDETTLPMKIDLVDLNTVDEDFKKQALSEGILWTV
jgi:predicted nucleotidyltransferase